MSVNIWLSSTKLLFSSLTASCRSLISFNVSISCIQVAVSILKDCIAEQHGRHNDTRASYDKRR